MPPLANEAAQGAYWASQPTPSSRAEWINDYATALGSIRPGILLNDAYRQGIRAHAKQSKIHPKVAALADVVLGPV